MDIYQAITCEDPVWIDGADFFGMNYGREYGRTFQENHRKIVLSGRDASYFCLVPEEGFPQNAEFREREPHMVLSEASHVGEYRREKTTLTLEQVVLLLKTRKVKF